MGDMADYTNAPGGDDNMREPNYADPGFIYDDDDADDAPGAGAAGASPEIPRLLSGKRFVSRPGRVAPIVVASAARTCSACPAQWEGVTDDGRQVYARYRGSCGYVSVARRGNGDEFAALPPTGDIVVGFWRDDDPTEGFDGYLDDHELAAITEGSVRWPFAPAPRGMQGGE